MSNKKKPARLKPGVALCYIRQSYSRDESDANSPERQRSNIELVCERNRWLPEWYEDVGGHRSGTTEDNRPGWIALKKRLGDADVAAVVANDLSRLHRNLARLSQLIETLEKHQISLVLAASNNDIDVTTLTGQMFAQMRGLLDAFYAKDISAKAKDSIAYRKRQGKTVAIPPFGTIRNTQGYLEPTRDGAWLLPNGTFAAGIDTEEPPKKGAVWKGYHECAHQILRKYAHEHIGMQRIAYDMNEDGWAFRSRDNTPRLITRGDVRRVIGNWAEYGGIVQDQPAKKRPAYDSTIKDIPFVEDRAVFSIELLQTVAEQRQQRSIRPRNHGVNRETRAYALAGLIYCAHCEKLAKLHGTVKLRKRLRAMYGRGNPRYRHVQGVKCGSENRSVLCEDLEAEFGRLIKLLDIRPEAIDLMTELAIQSDKNFEQDAADFEQEKQENIALLRRRIDAAVNLYRDGRITREEYLHDVQRHERDLAHWQARTTETQKLAVELALCVEAIKNVEELWDISDNAERHALANNLFTEVVYNLDTRRIESFKLKPWADKFLSLRGTLYTNEYGYKDDSDDGTPTTGSGHPIHTDVSSKPLGGT